MRNSPRRPCIFFDRDGVANRSPGPGYVNHLDDFHIRPGFVECIRVAAAKGYPAVIVTNQRGIFRGITPPEQLAAMHQHLRDELAAEGLALLDILVCTADDPTHPHRKPNPGMLLEAAERHHLDLARSWMIGDRESDVPVSYTHLDVYKRQHGHSGGPWANGGQGRPTRIGFNQSGASSGGIAQGLGD